MSAASDRVDAFLMGLWAVDVVDMVGTVWLSMLGQMVHCSGETLATQPYNHKNSLLMPLRPH